MSSRVCKIRAFVAAFVALVLWASSCIIGVMSASADEAPSPTTSETANVGTAPGTSSINEQATPSLDQHLPSSTGSLGPNHPTTTSTPRSASKYKVEFDVAAKGISNPPTQEVPQDKKVTKPRTNPARPGFYFLGWFNRDLEFDFNSPVTSDMTLTAHWTKQTGSWTMSPDHGTIRGATKVTILPPSNFGFTQVSAGQAQSLAVGSDGNAYTWTDKTNPVKLASPAGVPEDFRFTQVSAGQAQSLAVGSDGNAYTIADKDSGVATLKPISKPTDVPSPSLVTPISVKFDGLDSPDPPEKQKDGTWQVYTPVHAKGAVDVTMLLVQDGNTVEEHKSYTYQASSYTVTFDKADESVNSKYSVKVDEDEKVVQPQDPSRNGWLFDGWFLDSGNAYDFNNRVTSNLSLTAHWTEERKASKQPLMTPRSTSSCVNDTANLHWKMKSPCRGPEAGNNTVIFTPPATRGTAFTKVATSGTFSAALDSKGSLFTWGSNSQGQLANGSVGGDNVLMPTEVTKPAGVDKFDTVVTGHNFGLVSAKDAAGKIKLYSWGNNDHGQLGDGTTIDRYSLTQVKTPIGYSDLTIEKFDAGYDFAVALCSYTVSTSADKGYALYSWGGNEYGQLGIDSTTDQFSAVQVSKLPSPGGLTGSTSVSAGDYHVSVAATDHRVYSWGRNDSGQLGDGTQINRLTPVAFIRPTSESVANSGVEAGGNFTVLITTVGDAYSWGDNQHGSLGIGRTVPNAATPQLMRKSPGVVKYIYDTNNPLLGYAHGFIRGLDANNISRYYAFGSNSDGQLGLGNTVDQFTPVPTSNRRDNPANYLNTVYAGANSSFGHFMSFDDAYIYSWGRNDFGQLGIEKNPTGAVIETRAKKTLYPSAGVLKGVKFDSSPGTDLKLNDDDTTWSVTVPEHDAGEVIVTVDWSLWGTDQPQQDYIRYTYVRTGVLPNAGGSGLIPMLIVLGFLTMAGSLVAHNYRQNSTRLQRSTGSC